MSSKMRVKWQSVARSSSASIPDLVFITCRAFSCACLPCTIAIAENEHFPNPSLRQHGRHTRSRDHIRLGLRSLFPPCCGHHGCLCSHLHRHCLPDLHAPPHVVLCRRCCWRGHGSTGLRVPLLFDQESVRHCTLAVCLSQFPIRVWEVRNIPTHRSA